MKLLTRVFLLCILPIVVIYALLLINNHRQGEALTAEEIQAREARSIQWLLEHRDSIYQQNNPMLWWMLQEAAQQCGNAHLQAFAQDYIAAFRRGAYDSPWQMLFYPQRSGSIKLESSEIGALPDYNQYFLFALSCNKDMAAWPLIEQQNDVHYCRNHKVFAPACVTHQMMGYRFLQRRNCAQLPDIDARIRALQNTLVLQLQVDPRLVDVYMQRVLMLVDSGAATRVQARWLQRLMDAQLPDGSWAAVEPLLRIGHLSFGFNANGFTLQQPTGDFHITAQAILLMSYLQAQPALLQQINANR